MTSVVSGSETLFFHNKEAIVSHLLQNVLANTKQKIGTEWEMFFIRPEFFTDPDFFKDPAKKSFTRADGQKVFAEFTRFFKRAGYQPEYIYEKHGDDNKITGIDIPTLGTIVPEAGYQFEFSCFACDTTEEVQEKNEEAYRAVMDVAKSLNLEVVFKGHVPGFAEKTENMGRSRSLEWARYYDGFSKMAKHKLHEFQDGTASIQVTIDSGAENFHEFFKALLLIEPALTCHYANSNRSYMALRAYGEIISSQVEPIVDVWKSQSPREALDVIIDRLLEIEVPFLPDPQRTGFYKAEPLVNGRPATVEKLMQDGRLNEKVLNNVCGFFYMRPTLKLFSHALLEVRGVDSQPDPKTVAVVAKQVSELVYDDQKRRKLLQDYAYLSCSDIQKLHSAAQTAGKEESCRIKIANMTMGAFVADIMSRCETEASGKKAQESIAA